MIEIIIASVLVVLLVLFSVLAITANSRARTGGKGRSDEYTIKYRLPGSSRMRTLRHVIGDGVLFVQDDKTGGNQYFPVRYFLLSDDGRVEMPMEALIIYGGDRVDYITEQARKETGVTIRGG